MQWCILGALAACGTPAPEQAPSAPPASSAASVTAAASTPAAASAPLAPPPALTQAPTGPLLVRPKSRWVPMRWSELPGLEQDALALAWPALLLSCERPAPGWAELCAEALAMQAPDEAAVRDWLVRRLQPYRVEAPDGNPDGLITGYFEPLIEASRLPRPPFVTALHQPPTDLGQRRPYWTRRQLDTQPVAQAALRGREIAYVADPLDALVLHIQGSGRLLLSEPDGTRRLVRLAFAAHNDQPYRSIGRWLIDQGEMRLEQASWPAIKAWARAHPRRVREMLHVNPRVVFFEEEPLPDPTVGPRGAQGVPLTPGRSIAVDRESIPYGTPVWIDTTEPLSARPLQRLVVAQDTGGAIVGAVRADYFWGWSGVNEKGAAAEQAGRMKQPLRMWVLWPRP